MLSLTVWLHVLCLLLLMGILGALLFHDEYSFEKELFNLELVLLVVYNFCCILEGLSQGMRESLAVLRVRWFSVLYALLFQLAFMMRYVRYYKFRRARKALFLFLALLNFICVGMSFGYTNLPKFTSLQVTFTAKGKRLEPAPCFVYGYYSLLVTFYCLLLIYFSIYNYHKVMRKKEESAEEQKACRNILIGTLCPGIAYLLYAFPPAFHGEIITSAGLFAGVCFLSLAVFRYRFFDVVMTAKTAIWNKTAQAFIVVDSENRFLECNDLAKRLFPELAGMEAGETVEKNEYLRGLVHERKGKEFAWDGNYYESEINPVMEGESLQGYAISVNNTTEKHRYINLLIEKKEEADCRNHAKSDFLARISHDIRTPLHAIIGMSGILLRKNLDEEMLFGIKSIQNSGEHLLAMVNNLLDLSKIEAGKFELSEEIYELDHLLYDVSQITMMNLYHKPVVYQADVEPGMPNVLYGDALRVKSVLLNLLGNAVKFTSRGSVQLQVNYERKDEKHLRLIFRVSDTGIGIREEDKETIFGDYWQVEWGKEHKMKGTGLGLGIVRELAGMMGGDVQVESQLGQGSVFTVDLIQEIRDETPVSYRVITKDTVKSLALRRGSEGSGQIAFPQAKVLVVDDVYVNLEVTKGLLEPYEIQVETASGGMEAIELSETEKYDLIFMDYKMEDMDGTEAVKQIHKKGGLNCQTPCVALSADAMAGVKEFVIKNGFAGYLSKPVLGQRLEQILYRFFPEKMRVFRENRSAGTSLQEPLFIDGIDTAQGLQNTGGRESNYINILKIYLKEMQNLRNGLDENEDTPDHVLGVRIHGIKSSSGNVGALKVACLAEEVEQEMSLGKDYSLQLEALKHAMDDVLLQMDRYFQEKESGGSGWMQSLLRMRDAFCRYDTEEMENSLKIMKRLNKTQEEKDFTRLLESTVEELEYEEGLRIIEEKIEKNRQSFRIKCEKSY